jgi:hypothetical protein
MAVVASSEHCMVLHGTGVVGPTLRDKVMGFKPQQ